jgi:hypothetical protein
LWRADGFDTGPLFTWAGLSKGRFSPTAAQLVGTTFGSGPRQARVIDATTGEVIATLDEAAAAAASTGGGGATTAATAGGGGPAAGGRRGSGDAAGHGGSSAGAAGTNGDFVRSAASACFSPSGDFYLKNLNSASCALRCGLCKETPTPHSSV